MLTEQDKDYCHNEDTILMDDMEATNAAENTEKTKNSSDLHAAMIAVNIKQTIAAVAGNISSIGTTLKRVRADTASPSNA